MTFNQTLNFTILLIVFCPLLLKAQVKSTVTNIHRIDVKTTHFQLNNNLPDSLKKVTNNHSSHFNKIDTLFSYLPDSLIKHKPNLPDQNIRKLQRPAIDSATLKNQLKAPMSKEFDKTIPSSDDIDQYKQLNKVKIESSYLKKDSLKNEISEKKLEEKTTQLINDQTQAQEKINEEFTAIENAPSVNSKKLNEEYIKNQKALKKVFTKNRGKIKKGQLDMNNYKDKYRLSNSLSLDGPKLIKKNTKPEKRWQYGLGLNLAIDTISKISIAPFIAYNVNNKWRIGSGFSNHLSISLADNAFDFNLNRFIDFRFFNQYFIYSAIFTHLEYEKAYQLSTELQPINKKLNPKLWIGLGVEFKIYKSMKGQTQLLYNVIHKNKSPSEAITIRFNLIR